MPRFRIAPRSQLAAAQCTYVQTITHQQVPAALSISGGRRDTSQKLVKERKAKRRKQWVLYLLPEDHRPFACMGCMWKKTSLILQLSSIPSTCLHFVRKPCQCSDIDHLREPPASLPGPRCWHWKSPQEADTTSQLHKPYIRERVGRGFRSAALKHSLPNHLNPGKGRGNVPLTRASTAVSPLRTCPQFACSDNHTPYSRHPAWLTLCRSPQSLI